MDEYGDLVPAKGLTTQKNVDVSHHLWEYHGDTHIFRTTNTSKRGVSANRRKKHLYVNFHEAD